VEDVVGKSDVSLRVIDYFVERISLFLGVKQQICQKIIVALSLFVAIEVFE
jgi:hypothetical protein